MGYYPKKLSSFRLFNTPIVSEFDYIYEEPYADYWRAFRAFYVKSNVKF